jgi:L-cysteine S-thiosulfotransferase
MKRFFAGAVLLAAMLVQAPVGAADNPDLAKYISGAKKSGYVYAEPETRSMQDDEFANPAMMWAETGEKMWSTPDGEAGKSCQSCHGDAKTTMAGIGAVYPKFSRSAGKVIDLEQRINLCREGAMQAKPFKWETKELLSLTTFVKMQSRFMPVNVSIDGPAAAAFEKGKEQYYQRRGQLDLACNHCHEQLSDQYLRAERLSQGQSNGFPTYRLKWQKLGSLHKRFQGCNENIRAEPYPLGSEEYTNLELYLAWRSNGLPVETPSVRK